MSKNYLIALILSLIALQFTGGLRSFKRNIPTAVCMDLKPVFATEDGRDCPGEVGSLLRFAGSTPLNGRTTEKSIFERNSRDLVTTSTPLTDNEIAKRLCVDGYLEVSSHKSRADCVTDQYAIEVERTSKFKEALGQALVYGSQNQRLPMIYLYCSVQERETDCAQNSDVLHETIVRLGLPIRFKEFRERALLMSPGSSSN